MKLVSHASSLSFTPQHVALCPPFIYSPLPIPYSFTRATALMADRDRPLVQPRPHQPPHRYEGISSLRPQSGPSTAQILAVITLLPISGALLGLAGLTLVGSLIGLAVATPLFVIFSPVLVPAAILIAGAVVAFLTSGAFGLTGLSSISWVFNSFRQATGQEPLAYARQRVQEGTVYVGEKTKQVGETIKSKAQEGGAHESVAATAPTATPTPTPPTASTTATAGAGGGKKS